MSDLFVIIVIDANGICKIINKWLNEGMKVEVVDISIGEVQAEGVIDAKRHRAKQ